MASLQLPHPLLNAVLSDQAVLFLGAGASRGAISASGAQPPTADQLRDLLSDTFLGGNLKDRPLGEISDYVANETSLGTLQEFLYNHFLQFEPGPHHLLIPLFPWHTIVTTNYDLVVERAYQQCEKKVRDVDVYLKNGEKVDVKLRQKHGTILYIKLHGCITQYRDTSIPLVVSNEQISKYRNNRDRLFERFCDIGSQCSVVFCGYSIGDPHIREILFDLTNADIERPRYYLVKPDIDEYQARYWEKNRFTVINSGFADFLTLLQGQTSETDRKLATISTGGDLSISSFYHTAHPTESVDLKKFLDADMTHVRQNMPAAGSRPHDFYSGYDQGWWPIEQELDVRRDIADSVIVEAVLKPLDRNKTVDLFVLKGPAGNGKSVLLKRIAWDAAKDYEQLVLHLNADGSIDRNCLLEICDLTGKRIIVMIDHVALRVDDTVALLEFSRRRKLPITIIVTERDNEWNVRCTDLARYVTAEFPVGYLSTKEIKGLIGKLESHDCLGNLKGKSPEARVAAFADAAQRQLLVALHEATLGIPFEVIIRDEYQRVTPDDARLLYLDVCTLNRLGVPVRAGLISRVSGITFQRFQAELFAPLEHLVRSYEHKYLHEFLYEARHPHVAELVFAQALPKGEDRYEQVLRLLNGMNLDYSSDNEAFHSLVKGRTIAEIFDIERARKLFEAAARVGKNDWFVFHQEAVMEMTHKAGNLVRAGRALEKAQEAAPWNRSVQHSVSNLKRKMALEARTPLEKAKLRQEAKVLIGRNGGIEDDQPFGLYTSCQILVDELEELIASDSGEEDTAEERKITENIKAFEIALITANQRFPKNEQFAVLEARFHGLLDRNEKADRALEKAFTANPRSEYIASRLAERYSRSRKFIEAKNILNKCLDANPGARVAHYKLAMLLMASPDPTERSLIIEHLRKSFTDGDSNLGAQFWYGRELFITGRFPEADVVFERLWDTPMPPQLRNDVRGAIADSHGVVTRFTGELVRREESFGFVRISQFPREIYADLRDSEEEDWRKLYSYSLIECGVAFTMRGARAVAIKAKQR